MSKKKIAKPLGTSWSDIEEIEQDLSHIKGKAVDPRDFFKNCSKVGAALLECLLENDTEAFLEILDEYLRVNRSGVAKNAQLARSTVQDVFSKKGNPTLKTLAKIVHHEAGFQDSLSRQKN